MRYRPRDIRELWLWAYTEHHNALIEPPDKLHVMHPYPERDRDMPKTVSDIRRRPLTKPKPAAIVGRPFSREFVRYLDGVKPMTAARKALRAMHSRDRVQSPQYRLCFAVLEVGHDLGAACAIARVSEAEAEQALRFLWEKTQLLVSIEDARAPKPRQAAGTA